MSIQVEVWDARPAWLALSVQDRIDFLDQMAPGMEALTDAGASLVGAVLKEFHSPFPAATRYVAVWSMPDGAEQVQMLNEILEAAGWGEYFREGSNRKVWTAAKSLFQYGAEIEGLDSLPHARKN